MIRELGDFKVSQRTKDSMFHATSLLKQWNNYSGQKKQMIHFTENKSTEEFIQTLQLELNAKQRNSVIIKTSGKNGGTWMHPYLFIDFAMWLNPSFKYKVIQFVYDQLINFRNYAGDNYIGLTDSIAIFEPKSINYVQLAKALNHIVFGKHVKGLRQIASQEQLEELTELQKKLAFSIDMGFIKSFDELMVHLRRIWYNKSNN